MSIIQDNPDAVRSAAIALWADAVWDDDQSRLFRDKTGSSPMTAFSSRNVVTWPLPPMPDEYVAKIGAILERVEQNWVDSAHGHDLADIARIQGVDIDNLCFHIAMEAVGHGIGVADLEGWPDDLEVDIFEESPAHFHLPTFDTSWADRCIIAGVGVREYAGQWGSGDKGGALYYSFQSGDLETAEQYDALLGEIDMEINFFRDNPDEDKGESDNLARLYNHVLWERINFFGRENKVTEKDILNPGH